MPRNLIPATLAATIAAAFLVALGPFAPQADAATSGNLIVNPGAEVGECSVDGQEAVTLPGWAITKGSPTIVCYGSPGGYPTSTTPGAPSRGNGFFAGGATGDSTMEQNVDVSSAALAIDAGGVTYALSGWLGGWSSQNDTAGIQATFISATGKALGSATIAPVTASDRGNTTEFLQRSTSAGVPAGTRSIKVDVNYTWSAGNTTDGYVDNLSLTLSTAVTQATLAVPASSVPGYDHVFMIYMENEDGFPQSVDGSNYIYGNSAAPYINNTLLPMGTRLNNLYATTHPSDPNYLAIAGGSVSGQTTNPTVGSVNATNLADRVETVGKTWKAYNEGANGNCDLTNHGSTYPDDEPFTLYNDIANDSARCNAHIAPLTQLTADLMSTSTTPNFSWIAANDYNDMEGGGIAPGDTWLSKNLPTIFNSPAWKTQRSLLIVAWDEGYTKAFGPGYPNEVAGVLIGSQGTANPATTSTTRHTQYSIGRTIEDALGLTPMTPNDTYAQPINDAWTKPASSTLSTTTAVVANGSSVTFSYTTPSSTNSSKNWIGIYKQGDTPGTQYSTDWQYAPGVSGTVTFTANYGKGSYQVYYFYNDGYTILAGPVALQLN